MATRQPGLRHKHWLQRNRIDASNVCFSVGIMKQSKLEEVGVMKEIRLKETVETSPTPLIVCQRCGGPTRLIGSEAHPVQDNIDLLTYCCMGCEEFTVLPIPANI
jgi:hypothetical protein